MGDKVRANVFILALLLVGMSVFGGDESAERMVMEFSNYTNAVVAMDEGGRREMHRLARDDGAALWVSVGCAVVDMKGRSAVWRSVGDSGADGFGGLCCTNTILVHIPEGTDKTTARPLDGDVASFEVWKGWRKLTPNDSWLGFTMQRDYKPYWADAGVEMFYDWPDGAGHSSHRAMRLLRPTSLWVMRATMLDGRMLWDFGYRPLPTLEETRAELRREIERIIRERDKRKLIYPVDNTP